MWLQKGPRKAAHITELAFASLAPHSSSIQQLSVQPGAMGPCSTVISFGTAIVPSPSGRPGLSEGTDRFYRLLAGSWVPPHWVHFLSSKVILVITDVL